MVAINIQKLLAVVAASVFTFANVLFSPVTLRAEEMFQMEESEAPPKGVKQMAEEIRKAEEAKQAEQAAQADTRQEQTAQPTSTGAAGGAEKKKKEKANYHGVFDALTPLSSVLPLKSGNIKLSYLSLANNTGSAATFLSRRNMTGGYFFETAEQNVWKFKNVTAKTQYNRQLRNTLSVNSMDEISADAFGADIKYIRTVGRTGGGVSQNVSDARKFSVEYKKENGFAMSYNIDQNISKTIGGAPTKTNNKKQTWSLTTPVNIRKGAKLTLTNSDTGNWNVTGNTVTKVRQTDAKLDIPVSKQFEVNLAYQFLANRNAGAAAASSENRKNTRSLGLSYKFAEDAKLTYMYNFSSNHNFSAFSTNFDTVNRDAQFERSLSNDAKIKMGYTNTYDQSSGRTTVRTGSFSYDHKDFWFLPGSTSVDTRKQFTGSAGNSNTNYTLSVNTPLSYMKGKLTTTLQNVLSVQNALSNSQRTRSLNQTFATDYKITQKLAAGVSFNRVKNGTFTPVAYSALSVNHIRTDKLSYDFGKKLSFWKRIDGVKYNYAVTRNNIRNEEPAATLTANRVRNHMIDFALKGNKWSGGYGIGRSFSQTTGGQPQRALQHKLGLSMEDLLGCQLSTNYIGSFQQTGSQVSAIFKLTRKISDKTSYFFSYEALRNKSRAAGAVNSQNRFLELGADLTF